MRKEIDLSLANKLQFYLNHRKQLIESDDPTVFLRSRGSAFSQLDHRCFRLHWDGRDIPADVRQQSRDFGRNAQGQRVFETHWTVQQIGFQTSSRHGLEEPYRFKSQEEYIGAANLILKGLRVYGGTFHMPELNSFPEYRRITSALSDGLKAHMYRVLN